MLTEKEYRLNILCFEILSYFGIIPFEMKGLQAKYPGKKRLVLWLVFLTAQVFHAVMAVWLLLSKVIFVGQAAIPTLTLDYCIIVAAIMGIHSAIQNFIRFPEVAQCIWKSAQDNDTERRNRKGGPFGYTYLDIYTMLSPLCFYPAVFAIVVAYNVICIWPITQGFHAGVRTALVFAEALFVTSQASWVHFGLITQITFMGKVGLTTKTQMQHLQRRLQIQEIQDSIHKLRELQVSMKEP